MAKAPVIHQPSVGNAYPLLKDFGSGNVPAFATDPCSCCDSDTVDLGCVTSCTGGIAAATCTVEVSGVVATGSSLCNIAHDCNQFNDTFVLDLVEVSGDGLLPCDYKLDLNRVFCERSSGGACLGVETLLHTIVGIVVLPNGSGLTVRFVTQLKCSGGTVISAGASEIQFFDGSAGPGGINCVDGVYELPAVISVGDGIEAQCSGLAAGTATVTFNG